MIDAALGQLRALAESAMTATGTIAEPSQPGEKADDTTGDLTTTPGATVYAGKMRVRSQLTAQEKDLGAQKVSFVRYACFAPWSVTGLRPGQELRVTASTDPDLAGKVLIVEAVEHHEPNVHRKFSAVENQD